MNQDFTASALARRHRLIATALYLLLCLVLAAPTALAQEASGNGAPADQAAEATDATETTATTETAEATVTTEVTGAAVSLSQLADLLADDAARARLIQTLRNAAAAQPGQAPAQQPTGAAGAQQPTGAAGTQPETATPPGSPAGEKASPVRQLAQATGAWVAQVGVGVGAAWTAVAGLWGRDGRASGFLVSTFDATAFWNGLLLLVLVVSATLVAYFVLRLLAGAVFDSLAGWPDRAKSAWTRIINRFSAVGVALIVDVAVVLLACAVGYATALALSARPGEIGTRAALFINAFVVVELVKVVVRAIFSTRHESLRLLTMPNSVAGWWSIRLRWFVGVIGYCLLLAVPIIKAQLSPMLGSIVGFIVMAAAYVYALRVALANRKLLTQRLLTHADNATLGFFAVVQRILARVWLVLAVVYLTFLFVGSQIDPERVLSFMLAATVQSLVAAAVALGLSGLLSRVLSKRITVSERTRRRLPMLEKRLNAYVPAVLKVARFFILIGLALVLADAWALLDLEAWLASETGVRIVAIVFHLLVIFAVAILLWIVIVSLLEHRLSATAGAGNSARKATLLALISNALAIVVITMTVMVALSQIGVDIGPLLAGAGVIGLAIGFGAQKLVADVITGIFIQVENAVNTGDVVSLAGITGTAEKITIRSLSVRDLYGTLHVVPFSSASVVSNYMREFGYHTYHYRIAYREDIDEAIRQLRAAFEDLQTDPEVKPNLLEDIAIPGVTALAENAVEIRVMIKTLPGTQWGVGRAYNRLVKMHFDAAGIEMPTAHRTLYFGRDKDGWSPPARVRMVDTKKVALRADVDTSGALDTSGREADEPTRDAGE